jgi:serine/threonine protein phosphatase 1
MFFKSRTPSTDPPVPYDSPIRPEVPFFAIGDVHGCDRLLDRLLKRLDREAHPEALLVLTGDYLDRGEETARVLRRLMVLSEAAGDLMHCIMGNHEMMLLEVLDNPVEHGPRWLRHGGLQTLASYRVPPVLGNRPKADWLAMRDQLVRAMGEHTIDWLRGLPLYWQTGNVVVVHAGADPMVPIPMQDAQSLLWGHPDFDRKTRPDGLWVVHGHTITQTPKAAQGRISTDTGGYATGILTAALVEAEQVTFLTA